MRIKKMPLVVMKGHMRYAIKSQINAQKTDVYGFNRTLTPFFCVRQGCHPRIGWSLHNGKYH